MAEFEIKDGVAIIPEGTTEIGEWFFARDYLSLKSVTIPESVKDIGVGAFRWCTALESITLPESVKVIGWNAFEGCTSLKRDRKSVV